MTQNNLNTIKHSGFQFDNSFHVHLTPSKESILKVHVLMIFKKDIAHLINSLDILFECPQIWEKAVPFRVTINE